MYCANYGERWGVPFCVGEMSEAAARKQYRVFRLAIEAGLPRELIRINGTLIPRGDPETSYEGDPWTRDAARFVYNYRADATLVWVDEFSQAGRKMRRLSYEIGPDNRQGIVRFDRDIGVSERQLAADTALDDFEPYNSNTKTSIGQHRLVFDGAGYLLERHFEPLGGGALANDANGVYGRAYRYSELGLPVSVRNLDADGVTLSTQNGLAEVRRSYDNYGRLKSVQWVTGLGKPVQNNLHYAQADFQRDQSGRIVVTTYKDERGQQTAKFDVGVAKEAYIYDTDGNRVEEAYFTDELPTFHKILGVARVTRTYDKHGVVVEEAYFGTDGRLSVRHNGYAILKKKYDQSYNLIEEAYFGTDGTPVLHKGGYARLVREYDAKGNLIENAYFGLKAEPISVEGGYATIRFTYDKLGNLIEEAYFGTDRTPVLHKGGYARLVREYDAKGNLTKEVFIGLRGEPVSPTEI